MTKQFKNFILFILISAIFLLSTSASAQTAPTITDPPNDVMRLRTTLGSNGQTVTSYSIVSDHPNIDILSASYVNDGNNSATITLTVKGKIEFDNTTFYQVDLNGTSSLSFDMYYSNILVGPGSILQSTTPNTVFSLSNDYLNSSLNRALGVMHSYKDGSNLIMTLDGNNMTTADGHKFNLAMPQNYLENSTTNWHIRTFQGSNTTALYLTTFGDTFWDYYPNSDNKYTNIYQSQATPGFELLSIFAIPAVVIIHKKLKKLHR